MLASAAEVLVVVAQGVEDAGQAAGVADGSAVPGARLGLQPAVRFPDVAEDGAAVDARLQLPGGGLHLGGEELQMAAQLEGERGDLIGPRGRAASGAASGSRRRFTISRMVSMSGGRESRSSLVGAGAVACFTSALLSSVGHAPGGHHLAGVFNASTLRRRKTTRFPPVGIPMMGRLVG